jgi:hypothetical protein
MPPRAGCPNPAKFAALSAGQAVAVAHVAAHDLGAAAYPIKAASARVPADDAVQARAHGPGVATGELPAAIRELVLDYQQRRSAICWQVFDEGDDWAARAARSRSALHGGLDVVGVWR